MPLPRALRALACAKPTVTPVPGRALIAVTGSQAGEFLNGLTAASVPNSPSRGHFYTAFLQAQGRVMHDIFVWSQETPKGTPEYIVEYDARPSEAPPLLQTLKRHILRSRVKLRDVSEEYDVWAAFGPSESRAAWDIPHDWSFAQSGVVEPLWSEGDLPPWGSERGVLRDRRAHGLGERLLVRKGDRPERSSHHDTEPAEAYLLHRILHGVPEGTVDIPPLQAFPMDSNIDLMGGVDFRKGCYVGQELTVRTYHTGQLRKRILPVVLHDPALSLTDMESSHLSAPGTPPSQLDIRPEATEGDGNEARPRFRGTGKLLSSTRGVGLALLRLEQVEAVAEGRAKFVAREGQSQWGVTPYWPDWWPKRPPLEDSE